MKQLSILLFLGMIFISCETSKQTEIKTKVKTGIEVLRENNYNILEGKRVGLITNPTGIDSELNSTVDILFNAKNVNLVALYGPEHGVRGNFSAGDHVEGNIDPVTKLPVHSLYGKTRKPTAEMLKDIDVLIYDIQDIGARSYTYISTMGLAMEAAAENDIEFIVLDRPNPLGGNKIEGPIVKSGFESFVSQFPIPYVYGLTPGELAVYLNKEGLLKDSMRCKLKVVKMTAWNRDMTFEKTGLPWVPTSPHIPHASSSYFYAVSGILGELDANMIGVGYTLPFQIFAMDYANADTVCQKMQELKLEGVNFRPIWFKPYYMNGKGNEYGGIQVYITDYEKVKLTEIQFYFAQILHELYPEKNLFNENENRHRMFDLVCGSDTIRKTFSKNYRFLDIKTLWSDNNEYKKKIKLYYLYR